MILDDVKAFFNSESWYLERGIPWRRGHMFYGPPGTGKTSFAHAMAGHLQLPLYLLQPAQYGMHDSHLQQLFRELSPPCVVLIEDITQPDLKKNQTIARPNMRRYNQQLD